MVNLKVHFVSGYNQSLHQRKLKEGYTIVYPRQTRKEDPDNSVTSDIIETQIQMFLGSVLPVFH